MIVLIDGFSIAFRAFYALPETLMTSKITPTNVIHGFLSMLNKITSDYKLEQLKRPINLRYENTIERLEKQNKEISKIIHKRERPRRPIIAHKRS